MQLKAVKQRRMHGVVPTLFEIPAYRLTGRYALRTERPILISLAAALYFIRGGACLLLALVPWNDSNSRLVSFLYANASLVYKLLPQSVRATSALANGAPNVSVALLPVYFFLVAALFLLIGWKLWTLSSRWRTVTILWSLFAIAKTVVVMMVHNVGAINPIPTETTPSDAFFRLVWNLLVVYYLVFTPGVKEAFAGAM